MFRTSFESENIYNRLERIEKKLFGTILASNSLSKRVERIESAIGNTQIPQNSLSRKFTELNNASVSVYANLDKINPYEEAKNKGQ